MAITVGDWATCKGASTGDGEQEYDVNDWFSMAGNTRISRRQPAVLSALSVWLSIWTATHLFVAGSASAQFPSLPSRPAKPAKPAPPKQPPADRNPELWEPGDEVIAPKPLPGKNPAGARPGSAPDAASESTATIEDGPTWSVLLMTFVGDNHAQSAIAARDQIAARVPQLREAFVRRVPQGSVLLVGAFTGPTDAAAQAKLKEVKQIIVDGQRAFPSVMLTRTTTDTRPPGPFDVRKLREHFPDVHPLYSLQVAAWSTFGEKTLSRTEIRASAERYCKELRAKGFEAWVHHDDNTGTSVVTVGHFDHTAYDSKSTLFAPEVEILMKKFPRNLVNGGEVLIPENPGDDPKKPGVKTRPQGCRLVEIPK
ncbi:MAG: hypothetical protein SGJ11_13000 [Phycisphaerae bacterium]|nr:hypothetical protein [Phycisphaerae bacterium]